jgi:hypothetical protein
MLKWILATPTEWETADIIPSSGSRTFDTDIQGGVQTVILDHFEVHSKTECDYTRLMLNMPKGSFLGDKALAYLLPVEVDNGHTNI